MPAKIWRMLIVPLLVLLVLQPLMASPSRAETNAPALAPTGALQCLPEAAALVYLPLVTSGGQVIPPDPMPRSLQYQVGKTYVYQYQMSTEIVAGKLDSQGFREEAPNTSVVRGEVAISITGLENGDIFVGALRFVDAVLCSQNADEEDVFADDPELLAGLQMPLLFKQRADGTIVEISSTPSALPEAVNLLKGVLNSLQASLQAGDTYTANEEGVQGSYTAHYTAQQAHAGLRLLKTFDQSAFDDFIFQGDFPSFTLENVIHMLLDRQTGVFGHVQFSEVIRSEDVQAIAAQGIEGVAVWNTSTTLGFLKLLRLEDTPTQAVAPDWAAYQATGLGVEFSSPVEPAYGIDLAELDLAAELDALEADPTNLDLFHRMTLILRTDITGTLDTEIHTRLSNHLDDAEVARLWIDLLGIEGSSASQAVLVGLVDPNNSGVVISPTLQEQALLNLALIPDPQPETLAMMTTIMDHPVITTHVAMATLALGAMAYQISDTHPVSATQIYSDLRTRLNAAATDQEVELLLTTLGNTGNSGLPAILSPYFEHPEPRVQWAAFQSLQQVPGQEAETALVTVLGNGTLSPFALQGAALALKSRSSALSPAALAALNNYFGNYPTPQGGIFQKTWTKDFGGERVGGSAPGHLLMASPPYVSRLELQTMQEVNFYLKAVHFNLDLQKKLLTAQAWSKPKGPTYQEFGIRLIIFGKTLKDEVHDIGCVANKTENIYNSSRNIYNYYYEYPVWGALIVGVGLEISGHFKMDYHYNWSMCNLANMTGQLDLTPQASLRATASGYAKLLRLRGGVSMEAGILAVKIPPTLTASYSLSNDFQACATVPLQISPLQGALKLFAEAKAAGKWNRFLEKTLWSFALPSSNSNLLGPQCWTP